MGRYLLGRLLAAVPTLLALTLVAFLLTTAARGDPALEALQQAGDVPTPEALAQYRSQLGLDEPLPVRYVRWLGGVARGDLGRSYLSRRPVAAVVGERVRATLILGLSALVTSTVLGVGLGTLFAMRQDTWIDHVGRLGTVFLAAIPSFWLAIVLIVLFGEKLRLLPVAGFGVGRHLVLPTLALSLGPAAALMRLTRARMVEVLGQDYVRTARAKGMREQRVALGHVLRNAAIPIAGLLGLRFGHILAGAVIVESVFAWPGMGGVVLAAISGRDLPVLGGYVLLAGVLFIGANLVVDVAYALLDPRIRLGAGGGAR
ncbi:MAG TPA: ABC transporter permease [Chloroflexota bacterium]|jgi:peptide/nickel transport system permease protein|nr:ABC transporter permease [Chloroflexota bacterium]